MSCGQRITQAPMRSYEQRCEDERQQAALLDKQKEALRLWIEAGGVGTFCSDALKVNLIFDSLELTYSEETGLKLTARDGDKEIDLTDSVRIQSIAFREDYPLINVVFGGARRTKVRAIVPTTDKSGINERIRQHQEALRASR